MAEAFKNGYQDVGVSYTAIYTVPASTEAVVKSLLITNVDGSASATISAKVLDSDNTTEAIIASTIEVPANSRIDLCADSLLFLEADDDIQLVASAAGDLEAFISVLEITA
jgi:predicted secreted protein